MSNPSNKKQKRVPIRMCIACRKRSPKGEMIRLVLSEEGNPSVDVRGKIPGRGANVCASMECFDLAVEKKAFGRAWKSPVPEDRLSALREEFREAIDTRGFRRGRRCVVVRVDKAQAEEKIGKIITRG